MKANMKTFHRLRSGFSLIELLVVITIVLVIAGLIYGVGQSAINNANKTKAASDAKMVAAAVDAYFAEYRHWPLCGDGYPSPPVSTTDWLDGDSMYNILFGGPGGTNTGMSNAVNDCGNTDGSGNFTGGNHGSANPKKIVFLSVSARETCPTHCCGNPGIWGGPAFKDPWGSFYNIVADWNADGIIDSSDRFIGSMVNTAPVTSCEHMGAGFLGTPIKRSIGVFSNGPDRKCGYGDPNYVGTGVNGCGTGEKCGMDDIVAWK